ncbi:hypothetical protein M427DRAFT_52904 [Gonapodya prolifera JEL478]|uniref:Uncharacterized protein n=1 Tax=Gonapodya prolifera (strain JEL478) TaxID=1344416 RepID=A0A139ARV0_GONPJ|nr:hypothetical protein M427DRAFT_52904 [Gonapodya prolifera JEL478]|eukprot:KXS19467.1 hypothetical protein M427DRAFT_52904 [Gonapodya prolifera JEL478]
MSALASLPTPTTTSLNLTGPSAVHSDSHSAPLPDDEPADPVEHGDAEESYVDLDDVEEEVEEAVWDDAEVDAEGAVDGEYEYGRPHATDAEWVDGNDTLDAEELDGGGVLDLPTENTGRDPPSNFSPAPCVMLNLDSSWHSMFSLPPAVPPFLPLLSIPPLFSKNPTAASRFFWRASVGDLVREIKRGLRVECDITLEAPALGLSFGAASEYLDRPLRRLVEFHAAMHAKKTAQARRAARRGGGSGRPANGEAGVPPLKLVAMRHRVNFEERWEYLEEVTRDAAAPTDPIVLSDSDSDAAAAPTSRPFPNGRGGKAKRTGSSTATARDVGEVEVVDVDAMEDYEYEDADEGPADGEVDELGPDADVGGNEEEDDGDDADGGEIVREGLVERVPGSGGWDLEGGWDGGEIVDVDADGDGDGDGEGAKAGEDVEVEVFVVGDEDKEAEAPELEWDGAERKEATDDLATPGKEQVGSRVSGAVEVPSSPDKRGDREEGNQVDGGREVGLGGVHQDASLTSPESALPSSPKHLTAAAATYASPPPSVGALSGEPPIPDASASGGAGKRKSPGAGLDEQQEEPTAGEPGNQGEHAEEREVPREEKRRRVEE